MKRHLTYYNAPKLPRKLRRRICLLTWEYAKAHDSHLEISRNYDVFGLQIAAEYALALLGSYPLPFHHNTKTSIEYNNPLHHYSDAVFGASEAASRWFWRNEILLTDDR